MRRDRRTGVLRAAAANETWLLGRPAARLPEAVRWGVAVYDWSNAKALWSNAQPMNCDDLLTKQAEMVQAADPGVPGE